MTFSSLKNLIKYASSLSILYVEDDKAIRESMVVSLRYIFKKIEFADNGARALDIYKNSKFDIVISDILMPKMNGIELTREIRKLEKEQVIIITSAYSDSKNLTELINLRVDRFIEKPINHQILMDILYSVSKNIYNEKALTLHKLQEIRLNSSLELLVNISHHWRQPLQSISLLAGNIEEDFLDGELNEDNLRDNVLSIYSNIQKLSKSIDYFKKIYNYKSIDDKKLKFNLSQSIDKVLRDRPNIPNLKVVKIIDKSLYIAGNMEKFIEAIGNILSNSFEIFLKNSIEFPKLKIVAKAKGSKVSISIEDNAGGVEPNIIERLFEPYSSTKFSSYNVGLGLFISKTVIEIYMQGSISLEPIEGGAIFFIELNQASIE